MSPKGFKMSWPKHGRDKGAQMTSTAVSRRGQSVPWLSCRFTEKMCLKSVLLGLPDPNDYTIDLVLCHLWAIWTGIKHYHGLGNTLTAMDCDTSKLQRNGRVWRGHVTRWCKICNTDDRCCWRRMCSRRIHITTGWRRRRRWHITDACRIGPHRRWTTYDFMLAAITFSTHNTAVLCNMSRQQTPKTQACFLIFQWQLIPALDII